jgi:general secretion pathway protein G
MTRALLPPRQWPREANASGNYRRKWCCGGLTLVELLIIAAIVVTLAAIGVPAYNGYRDRARITQAIVDIRTMEHDILIHESSEGRYPDSLDEIGRGGFLDPYGNPYQYLRIGSTEGHERKDHFLVPLNTDFDLYSMGKDGQSQPPLTARASRDDIVRANNGAYVGLASEY